MNMLLNYDNILDQLCLHSHKQPQDQLNQNEAYKLLDAMSKANKHQEFSYDIAVEIFDRIQQQFQGLISLEVLANVFAEANELIQIKYNFQIESEMQIQECKAFLKNIRPYGKDCHLHLDSIYYKGQLNRRPYIIVNLKEYIYESEVGYHTDGWYRWQINQKLPVDSLMNDLRIQILENRNILGNITLQCETLPFDDVKEAELPIFQEDGQQSNEWINIACQLVLNNSYKEMVNEKMQYYDEKSVNCSDEMYFMEQQLMELCKPFLTQAQIKLSPKRKIIEQNRYSGPRYTDQDQVEPPLTITKQLIPQQHDLFTGPMAYRSSLDIRPSIQASAFKQAIRLSSEQKQGKSNHEENNQDFLKWFNRTDIFATINLILSMLINFWRNDMISCCILLYLIMSVILKKNENLKIILILVGISLFYDILYFCWLELPILALLLIVLAFIMKIITFISVGLNLYKVENLYFFKENFLII